MILEERSTAEKIIKLFLTKILCLIKSLITENQIFSLKSIILLLKLMKEITKIMTQMMKKKKKTYLKVITLKCFDVIPMIFLIFDLFENFDLFKFLDEINLHISKLGEKNAANKVINKIAEDFKKIVVVTKLKELKQYAKNILPKHKK